MIGDVLSFAAWTKEMYGYTDSNGAGVYIEMASAALAKAVDCNPSREYCEMTLSFKGSRKKFIIELFVD